MIVREEFYLPCPHAEAWSFFSDLPSPLEIMPGKVELTELAPNKYRGGVRVHIGPFVFTFHGILSVTLVDHETHRVHIKGSASDELLKGHFNAIAYTQTLSHGPKATRVTLEVHIGFGGILGRFGEWIIHPKARQVVKYYRDAAHKEILRRRALQAVIDN